jgi:hypothetical protein
MIQILRSLLGGGSHEHPQPKAAPGTKPKASPTAGDYRAVSLEPCPQCRAAAKARDATGKRYLLREAPRLPLPSCTTPSKCTCKFRKHPDRRDDDRRLLGESYSGRWLPSAERRARRSRRIATN